MPAIKNVHEETGIFGFYITISKYGCLRGDCTKSLLGSLGFLGLVVLLVLFLG